MDGASRHSLLVGGDSRDSLDVADVLTLKSAEINTNAYAGKEAMGLVVISPVLSVMIFQ